MLGTMNVAQHKHASGVLSQSDFRKILDSYFGLLSHCKAYNLKNKVRNRYLYEEPFGRF